MSRRMQTLGRDFSQRIRKWIHGSVVGIGWISIVAFGQNMEKPIDLTDLDLEDLMNIEVTLVSRKPEKMAETAAAVTVLTQDDIQRSGVTTIPDALRLVPGIQVARIDANKWAISSRGFNEIFANKMLVLIDGRSVYSPIFSGVFWEAQDLFLRDIDRIEVVCGPGASLWGSNAVNGIINIITKKASGTQGGMVCLGLGSEEKGFGSFRYGGKSGKDLFYRFYVKYFNRDPAVFEDGTIAADGWAASRGGFRADWNVNGNQSVTLQGDLYGGKVGQTVHIPVLNIRGIHYRSRFSGGNVLGRWTHTLSSTSETVLQVYWDRVARKDTLLVGGSYNTYDADWQHRFSLGERHRLIWGAGFRLTQDQVDETANITCVPLRRSYRILSAFVQDEASFFRDRFRLVFGSKFEHNDFSGFEYQPSLRMLWKAGRGHSVWGSLSRAVRTPSRMDHDIRFLLVQGNPHFRSETVHASELGSHHRFSDRFYVDVSAYFNRYARLRSLEPYLIENKKSARTYGLETVADWHLINRWRLRGTYSYLHIRMVPDESSLDAYGTGPEQESPRHQVSICSSVDLPGKTDLDLSGRFVDKLPSNSLNVPAYFELDARLEWKPCDRLEFSINGQNLLHPFHPEFTANWMVFAATQVQRSVYGSVVWTF